MKLFAFVLALSFSALSFAAKPSKKQTPTAPQVGRPVYVCKDGSSRSFTVYQTESKGYIALFINFGFMNSVETYKCTRIGRGINFNCENGDSEARLALNAYKNMTVWFSLKGDFWPDSGSLFSINCKK